MLGAVAVLSFAVAFAALRVLLSRFARFALDQPSERSLQENPVPRTGGIALLAGAAVSLAFGALAVWLPLGLALALAVVSFVDDVHRLPTSPGSALIRRGGGARLVRARARCTRWKWRC